MPIVVYLLLAWLANIVSLLVADWIFDGVTIDGWWPLILGAAVLGIANTIIKPILTLLTLVFANFLILSFAPKRWPGRGSSERMSVRAACSACSVQPTACCSRAHSRLPSRLR